MQINGGEQPWVAPEGESNLFADRKCFRFTVLLIHLSFSWVFETKCWKQDSLGACHVTSCSWIDFGYRCRFMLLGYKETTLIMCQKLLLLVGHCAVTTSWNSLWNKMFFRSLSVCVCVIRSILNIPPVCISATQLLIKFPATNSRQHNDICITMAAPHLSVIQRL